MKLKYTDSLSTCPDDSIEHVLLPNPRDSFPNVSSTFATIWRNYPILIKHCQHCEFPLRACSLSQLPTWRMHFHEPKFLGCPVNALWLPTAVLICSLSVTVCDSNHKQYSTDNGPFLVGWTKGLNSCLGNDAGTDLGNLYTESRKAFQALFSAVSKPIRSSK